jgi:glycerol-3-phosphate dehydrogenase (NAD(P)+)
MSRISVIGGGAWGTSLTILLAEKGHAMTFWLFEEDLVAEIKEFHENRRFLPGFQIPETVEITSDPAAAKGSEILFFVVPTQFSRTAARRFAPFVSPSAIIVSAAKGIEEKTLKLPVEILREELKNENLCALSGPNLASEVARGLPAATVVASLEEGNARAVQESLMLDRFRVYTNTDIVGVQLGGALKNVIAIASGIAFGLNLGDNAKSSMMVRGIAEIARLGITLGAKIETFAGLSGIGDLIVTCSSRLSRNHQVGERIAKGEKLKDILTSMKKVAEGVPTTIAARELGNKLKVSLPITEEIYNVLYQGKDPYWAINDLMTRSPKTEFNE